MPFKYVQTGENTSPPEPVHSPEWEREPESAYDREHDCFEPESEPNETTMNTQQHEALLDESIADKRHILQLLTDKANLTSEVSRLRSEVSRLSGARMVPLPEGWDAMEMSRALFLDAESVLGGPKASLVPDGAKNPVG